MRKNDASNINVATLAFVGDGVFDLMVRTFEAKRQDGKSENLHERTISHVCCNSQSRYMKKILPYLTPTEESICKRGRNYHPSHKPKKSTVADYHSATALETLFGYLYLQGDYDRLREIFDLIMKP